MKILAWREVRRVLETNVDQFPWLPHLLGLRVECIVEVLILGVAEEAAGHVQQLANGDVLPVGNLGLVLAYRVVEPQPAFVYQLQDDRPGEGLGVAAYAEVVVWRDRGVALYVSSSKGLAPCSLARNIDVDERPRTRRGR